jgi:hypothetical protein
MGAVATAALVGGGLAAFVPASAGAATTLVGCTGISSLAKLNPTLKAGNAKYTKAANTGTTGTCLVDAGIRTNQAGQDVKYLLDDQTNGNAALTMLKSSGTFSGSASCNRVDTGLLVDYPDAYPLQGKLVWKFNQTFVTLVNIQSQQYVRLGTDPLDTDPTHITAKGIAIKGPGIGGDVSAALVFSPTASTKNVNLFGCVDNGDLSLNPATTSLAELNIDQQPSTSWDITIPS